MKKIPSSVLVLSLLFCVTGCGGTAFKTGKVWDPNEAPFFDDGVDVVEDLSSLSGKWAFEQEKDLDGRVQLADLVAKVEILSVRTSSDFDVDTGKRIEIQIKNILYGSSPTEKFALVSTKDSPGHELIIRYENRLVGSFFLYARWFEGQDGTILHHFHLSPVSAQMEAEINKRIEKRKRQEEEDAAKQRRASKL